MRTTYRITRRTALGVAAGLVAVGTHRARAQALDRVSYMTNWRAQAEHGGFYQAAASGIYRRHGIECDLRMGGPQQNPAQLLLAGRVDATMSNSLQALNYARDGLPFMAVAAVFQKDPQGFMVHNDAGNDSLKALKGKPILIAAGGRVDYWPWLRAQYGYTDEQIRPYTFNLGPFLTDKHAVQQAFLSSEPFAARQAGADPSFLLFADHGFENYQTTIDVASKFATERPEVLQRFIDASIEGWALYMHGAERPLAHELIKRDNPDMTDDRIAYADQAMAEQGIVLSGDAAALGIGAMTDARWERFAAAMVAAGVYPPGLDAKRAYSLQFVNRKVGI